MDKDTFLNNFQYLTGSNNGITKLKGLVYKFAIQGKLVEQRKDDMSANELAYACAKHLEKIGSRTKKQEDLDDLQNFVCPSNWVTVRNDKLFKLKKGKKPKKLNESGIGHVYLDIEALDRGNFTRYTEDEKCPKSNDEDILVVCDGSRSGLILDGKTGVVGSTLAIIESLESIRPFLRLMFKEGYLRLNTSMKGAAIPHLDTKNLMRSFTSLPPIEEQGRIIKKVDELIRLCDELEAKQQKAKEIKTALTLSANAKLIESITKEEFKANWHRIRANFARLHSTTEDVNRLRQVILQLAVRGKLVSSKQFARTAYDLLVLLKSKKEDLINKGKLKRLIRLDAITENEKLFSLPDGWVWCRLNDVIDVRDGTHDSPKRAFGPDTFPLITSKDFRNGKIHFESAKRISRKDHEEIIKRSGVEKDDILFSMIGGNIGNQVMVDDDTQFSIKNVALFKYYDKKITFPPFIKIFTEYLALTLQQNAMGGAQPFISLKYFRNIPFALPPFEEQVEISKLTSILMRQCDRLEAIIHESSNSNKYLSESMIHHILNPSKAIESRDQVPA